MIVHYERRSAFDRCPAGASLAQSFIELGKERGWPPVTKSQFDHLISPKGVLVVGGPEQVAEKLLRHSKALGGVDRFTFQMDNAGLSHEQLMSAIKLIGEKVIPLVKAKIDL